VPALRDRYCQHSCPRGPYLDESLVVEALLVADDLHRHLLASLVVQRPDHLAEAALADHLEDLEPERDVVVEHLPIRDYRSSASAAICLTVCHTSNKLQAS
jgi:hypothetical protein